MSAARSAYLTNIEGLKKALDLEILAAGSSGPADPPAIIILRRGVLIASLIALESFDRDRTTELLSRLASWPASFDDLPARFREAALPHALVNIQRYATMLKRNEEDYEAEIVAEVGKMASTRPPTFGFTRFIAGDFTGNISERSLKDLLSSFSITDCWEEFHQYSSNLGLGAPSVKEMLNGLVRNRHRSAHVAGYAPSAVETLSLPSSLICIGICFDTSMTASVECAIKRWAEFKSGRVNWRGATDIFFLDWHHGRLRVSKFGKERALRVVDDLADAKDLVRSVSATHVPLLVRRDGSLRPQTWEILI
jgi:hypothetical protein